MVTTTDTNFSYIGNELDVFAKATNWKAYWSSRIMPYLGKRVLEVGAGIGGTTQALCDSRFDRWLGIEPDAAMVADLRARQAQGEFPVQCEFQVATTETLSHNEPFDSVIYIDVLEHIEADSAELARAVQFVAPGGYIVALSPAFQMLYTEFDQAIGHYRRYTRESLLRLTPPDLQVVKTFYLDSVGMLASLSNKLLLHASQPKVEQILFWDRTLVPIARVLDPLLGYSLGRSVIGIWQKPR